MYGFFMSHTDKVLERRNYLRFLGEAEYKLYGTEITEEMWEAFHAKESTGKVPTINIDILLKAKEWKELTIKNLYLEVFDSRANGWGIAPPIFSYMSHELSVPENEVDWVMVKAVYKIMLTMGITMDFVKTHFDLVDKKSAYNPFRQELFAVANGREARENITSKRKDIVDIIASYSGLSVADRNKYLSRIENA